jgi:hypothetical protein
VLTGVHAGGVEGLDGCGRVAVGLVDGGLQHLQQSINQTILVKNIWHNWLKNTICVLLGVHKSKSLSPIIIYIVVYIGRHNIPQLFWRRLK